MKRKIVYLIISLLALILLYNAKNIRMWLDPACRFERAWQRNDSEYVKNFIVKMENENVETISAKCFSILSENTNFTYGILYFPKHEKIIFWDTLSDSQKDIIKYNIITVWNLYIQSKLFMKKNCKGVFIINGEEITFHEMYYPVRDKKFTSIELMTIKHDMDSIAEVCDSCNQTTLFGDSGEQAYLQ